MGKEKGSEPVCFGASPISRLPDSTFENPQRTSNLVVPSGESRVIIGRGGVACKGMAGAAIGPNTLTFGKLPAILAAARREVAR